VPIKEEPDLEEDQISHQEAKQDSEPGSPPSTEQLNAEGESDQELPDWHRYLAIIKKKFIWKSILNTQCCFF
jgi:hypothetical protein